MTTRAITFQDTPGPEPLTEACQFLTEHGGVPEKFDIFSYKPGGLRERMDGWYIRNDFLQKFGFAICTGKAIKAISAFAPIVEVGAGCGYWSYELRKAGVDVIATEPNPGQKWNEKMEPWPIWTEMEKLDGVEAVQKYPTRNLLTVWPSYDDPWAQYTLQKFTADYVLYIGEGHGGCTADDGFHKLLDKDFEEAEYVEIPQFFGIHDSLQIYRRRVK